MQNYLKFIFAQDVPEEERSTNIDITRIPPDYYSTVANRQTFQGLTDEGVKHGKGV